MLRKRINKNTLKLNSPNDPIKQRLMYVEDILKDSSFLPNPVEYKDIDEAFKDWVEKELKIVFEENELPTYALFSNQRYSEYMQMWETVDNNNNLKMNFKVITRENNPKEGTIYAKKGNIPRRNNFLMKRIEALNDSGKMCSVEFRMTQPMAIDFNYKITIITNKYELLNEFNTLVNNKFTSLHAYIYPNGHPMTMKLRNITDESEYTVDDRQYFAQTYEITLMGYVITKNDFDIEVKPIVTVHCLGGEVQKRKPRVEIEEFDEDNGTNTSMKISIEYSENNKLISDFVIDCDMVFTDIHGINIRNYALKVNDENVEFNGDKLQVHENDKISLKITKINNTKNSIVYIEGINPETK